jgi:hypothetical protein
MTDPVEILAIAGGPGYRPTRSDVARLVKFVVARGVRVLRHGNRRGLDKLIAWGVDASFGADDDRLIIEAWSALWDRHGENAGRRRDREMLLGDWSERSRDSTPRRADVLIAYPGDLPIVYLARELGIETIAHTDLPR